MLLIALFFLKFLQLNRKVFCRLEHHSFFGLDVEKSPRKLLNTALVVRRVAARIHIKSRTHCIVGALDTLLVGV